MINYSFIQLLSPIEQREFITFINKKTKNKGGKAVALFLLLAEGITEKLDERIYGKSAKNSYHALSKRLQDNLIEFIAGKSFQKQSSEELKAIKLLNVARLLLKNSKYQEGFKLLQKAAIIAETYELYAILIEIYQTKVQFAHYTTAVDLELIFQKLKDYSMQYQQEINLTMAFASIKAKLKNTAVGESINDSVTEVLEEFAVVINDKLTFKSLYQLIDLLVNQATVTANFYDVFPLINKAFTVIKNKEKGLQKKYQHYYVRVLYLMAVSFFRNKKFVDSLGVLLEIDELTKEGIGKETQLYKNTMHLRVLNLTFLGELDEGLKLLKKDEVLSLDGRLILIMCLFQKEAFQSAYNELKYFQHSDAWYTKKTNIPWVIKKNIIELLLLIELNKQDLVYNRYDNFKRRYRKIITELKEERVLVFIDLAMAIYEDNTILNDTGFLEKIESSFVWNGNEREDIFVMSVYAWLKSKIVHKSIYETTLALVTLE